VEPDFLFDAVLFDLDGTLLATDLYWIPAAREGARRAFAELGLDRRSPSDAQWMALVGLPLAEGFDALFADLTPEQRAHVRERCVEEEHFAIDAGRAALLPGVLETLEHLRARGVKLGIASNCSQAYLDSAMRNLVGELVDEGRCLDSPGVATKADMIEDLLLTFGTRSAVMVGDRVTDRDAAHANAIPHVHLLDGFAPAGEEITCEAVIPDMRALLPRLAGRATWILGALERLGCLADDPPRAIGVTGPPGAGKSLFARDAARLLEARGVACRVSSADERGAAALSLVVGPDLLHPERRAGLDRLVHLALGDEACLARLRARHLPLGERDVYARLRDEELPRVRALEREHDPLRVADLALDGSNPLGPGDQR
jgi:phosphoglycolate phosphatase-like HAD superfamily hydrolase